MLAVNTIREGAMRILVTGGAGYIGSCVAWFLKEQGHEVIVFDSLRTGHRDAVAEEFIRGDLVNKNEIHAALAKYLPEAVFHFAACSIVPESVTNPSLYYSNNLLGGLNLLEVMRTLNINYLVFSSTAAVYGLPEQALIGEDHPKNPLSPYGDTKLCIERMIQSYAAAYGLRFALLRYFNAAGAIPEADLGERHIPETHLVPIILQVAGGKRPSLDIYGRDYQTPDGTCIRDFIHIRDLAEAHLASLLHLAHSPTNLELNLGTGIGHSVLEVIACAERITNQSIACNNLPRRSGDPPVLVASPQLAKQALNWTPSSSSLDEIIHSAWRFYQKHISC